MKSSIAFVLALGLVVPAAADQAYVTDKLLAGLYEDPSRGQEPKQLLPSGTAVEVLEAGEAFQRVRLADGTEGWVDASYVTAEEPASSRLAGAEARVLELQAQLGQRTAADPAVDGCAPLADELSDARGRLAEIAALAGAAPQPSSPTAGTPADWRDYAPWVLLPAALLIGGVSGAAYAHHRVRKHFGGIRL